MAPHVTPFSEALRMPGAADLWRLDDRGSVAGIGREVARRATMIGYIDAFVLFTTLACMAIPLILLVRRPAAT